ncbi:nuclear pore complex protein NUP205 [Tanacetum coccineum]
MHHRIYTRAKLKNLKLLSGNDVSWTFIKFAGEDHTNFQRLVAFLKMLSTGRSILTRAASEEGASKVYELSQGRTFSSISWSTLFDCLSIYEDKFKQSLQSTWPVLPEIKEGDAKALVAYLCVLGKVVENGNPNEIKTWFPDIDGWTPNLKDIIWGVSLPVVVGPQVGQLMRSGWSCMNYYTTGQML